MTIRTEELEKRNKLQEEKIKALENVRSNPNFIIQQEDSLYLSGTKIEDLSFIGEIHSKRTLDLSKIDL